MGGWPHGDEHRWYPSRLPYPRATTIAVIEPPAGAEPKKHGVPFGFGVREDRPEVEPKLWEGDDS